MDKQWSKCIQSKLGESWECIWVVRLPYMERSRAKVETTLAQRRDNLGATLM